MAAQDAMVSGHICSFKTFLKCYLMKWLFAHHLPFNGLGALGSMSAKNWGTQEHATNDSVQQELPTVMDG